MYLTTDKHLKCWPDNVSSRLFAKKHNLQQYW